MSERFYVALARCDAGIRGMGGSDGSAAAARALRKGCDRKGAELSIDTNGLRQRSPPLLWIRPRFFGELKPATAERFRTADCCSSAVRSVHCAGSELVVLVFEQDVQRGERAVTACDILLQIELVRFAQFVARVHLLFENSQIIRNHDDFVRSFS